MIEQLAKNKSSSDPSKNYTGGNMLPLRITWAQFQALGLVQAHESMLSANTPAGYSALASSRYPYYTIQTHHPFSDAQPGEGWGVNNGSPGIDQWLSLRAPTAFRATSFAVRTDGAGVLHGLTDFDIQTSNLGVTWTTVAQVRGLVALGTGKVPSCWANVFDETAVYWRIFIPGQFAQFHTRPSTFFLRFYR